MTWFDSGTSKIYYEEEGTGNPVLFIPGVGGSIEQFSALRTALTSTFRVIAADPPGSGKSGPQPREYPTTFYQDDARSFLALLDHLGAVPAHVVGYSDGGEYALMMAILQPNATRSIAAWGAAGTFVEPTHGFLDAWYHMIDRPTEPLQRFSEYMKTTYGEANARAATQSFSTALRAIVEAAGDISRSRAGEIACPALLIAGEQDFFTPPAAVADIAGAIPGGEFIEVKGAGHDVHNAQLEWLTNAVVDWLTKH